MGYIGQKFLAHFVNGFFFLHVPLQFIVRCLQFRNGFLQGIGQLIDILSQQIDLIMCLPLIFCLKIQLYHPFRNIIQFQDRLGHTSGDEPDNNTTRHCSKTSCKGIEAVGDLCTLLNTGKRCLHNKRNAGIQSSVDFQIFLVLLSGSPDHIVIAVLDHPLVIERYAESKYITDQAVFQSLTAVDGHIFHIGIHIHNTYRHVVASAYVIQFSGEFFRAVAVTLRRLLDGSVSIMNNIQFALHIDFSQK